MTNDIQSVLLGALMLCKPSVVPEVLPDLEVEHFREELQPAFAAIQGYWTVKGELDIVELNAQHPDVAQTLVDCVHACESECVRTDKENMQAWAKAVQEQAAVSRFQTLAFKSVENFTTYDDLPDIYQQMGEALNLHSEKDDFLTVGDGIKNYIRHMDDKGRRLVYHRRRKRKLGSHFGDEYLQRPQLAESLRSMRTKEFYNG